MSLSVKEIWRQTQREACVFTQGEEDGHAQDKELSGLSAAGIVLGLQSQNSESKSL